MRDISSILIGSSFGLLYGISEMMSSQILFGISLLCCIVVVFCLSFFYVFINPGE